MRATARRSTTFLACFGALALGACSAEVSIGSSSSDPEDEAIELIEGRLADEAMLGPLTAECFDAEGVGEGGSFECTGTTEDGQVIEFTAEVDGEGAGEVNSTNLATPDGIALLSDEAARVLSEQNAFELPPGSVVCDDSQGFIFVVDATLDCEVTDPQSGEMVPAVLTITDPENIGFTIEITG
jgi:hypothetical protein